ncbi:MAG: site-2 protease family protein, partial [Alphaproteobacteria bacterium]|nr:site-2 protease family protein [Alphaproteobacteria bacterium]
MESVITLLFFLSGLIISIIIHEVAHGWTANKLGDPTARLNGRLSLNPIKHIDNFGSIILPLFLLLSGSGFVFGWVKPVPIDSRYFKHPLKDNLLVSSAGIIA